MNGIDGKIIRFFSKETAAKIVAWIIVIAITAPLIYELLANDFEIVKEDSAEKNQTARR